MMTRENFGAALSPLLLAAALLGGCSQVTQPDDPPAVEAHPVPEIEPNVTWRSPPLPPITIAAVGDIMLGTDYPKNHLPDDDGVSFLAPATPVLEAADVTFGNLEGVLMDGGEPVKSCKNPQACFLFRTPARYARHLKQAGFDVMSLANNHAVDFGELGRSETMRALASQDILHSGREGDIASWRVGGHRLAMIAFSPTKSSHSLLDIEIAAAHVAGLAAEHDIVLVSFHGGGEGPDALHIPFGEEFYLGEPRGDLVNFCHAVVDAGADLLIGHGPHVPRAMEIYNERLILYSLGNFATYYGISVEGRKGLAPIVTVTLDEKGRFLRGKVTSMVQRRPQGPLPDPSHHAYELMRTLTVEDFGPNEIRFTERGEFYSPEVEQNHRGHRDHRVKEE